MRPTLLFTLITSSFLLACAPERNTSLALDADDPHIRFTGRWNFDEPKAPWVGWQGSTVSVAFRGSGISATLEFVEEGETLRVVVDGIPEEPARLVPGGKQTVVLAAELDPDVEHTVTLMKEEFPTSRLIFHGLELADGEFIDLPPRPRKRIAFFGDSNMEGYSLYSEKNAGGNGTWFAYPATVTRMLGAEMYLQAAGSATLDGPSANDVVSFVHSEAYDREDPEYHDGFEPQVIVVNAGANDISRVPPESRKETVKQHYRNAIEALRDAYGDKPHIVLWNSYGWDPDEPALYNAEIVEELGGNLSEADFPWCWEQWHGDMVDHSGQAGLLAEHIVSLGLGFSLQRGLDVVDGYGEGYGVANGSFEGSARDGYEGFGWRYHADGVERIAIGDAADGDYVIRLETDERVHQCIDATGGSVTPTRDTQQFRITAAVRSRDGSGTAVLGADFTAQNLYQREHLDETEFLVDEQWQDYSATVTAPDGTWQTYVILRSANGELEFDNIRVDAL